MASATPLVESSRDSTSLTAPYDSSRRMRLMYVAKARRAAGDSAEAEQLLKAASVVLAAHPAIAGQFVNLQQSKR